MVAGEATVVASMAPLFVDWVRDLEELDESYTDDEPRTIADVMHRAAERQQGAIERLDDGP